MTTGVNVLRHLHSLTTTEVLRTLRWTTHTHNKVCTIVFNSIESLLTMFTAAAEKHNKKIVLPIQQSPDSAIHHNNL